MQIQDRQEFVRQMTANLPDRPAYFSYDVDLNLNGVKAFDQVPVPRAMTEEELTRAMQTDASVIDTRAPEEFGAGHFPGSINIGVGNPSFSTWMGFMVAGERPIALVVRSEKDAMKARLDLARIGFDNLIGYMPADALSQTQKLPQISVQELKVGLKNDAPLLVDVRTTTEWKSNHIEVAQHVPLSSFGKGIPDLPRNRPLAIICGSGYRSSIASSMLQARGYASIENVTGGMEAYGESENRSASQR
jgi:hydroxyacylglutathione hydrolase